MALVSTPGYRMYNTNSNRRAVVKEDITEALNVVWEGNRPRMRQGSTINKKASHINAGRIAKFITFKRRQDNHFFLVKVQTNGRIFYIRSDAGDFNSLEPTWNEINNPSSATPALAVNATSYDAFSFNNILFFCDTTNGYFSWDGTSADLTAETNPPSLGTANIVKFRDKSSRLLALDDGGKTHLSAVNDGTDFTTLAGGGVLNYGRVEGLTATNVASFGDDIIVTTEDPLSKKFQAFRLFGIKFFDSTVTGSDRGQFEVRKISSVAGLIGGSAQEITGDTIGLTTRGFVSLSKIIAGEDDLTERDFISFPVKELIPDINFEQANKIKSGVDDQGRYYCAVPFGESTTEAGLIFVYDFLRSSPKEGINRWSIHAYNNFEDIAAIGNIQGVIYLSDLEGNIYKTNDITASFADQDVNGVDNSISCVIRTADIGGADTGSEKDFNTCVALFTDLSTDNGSFDMKAQAYRDGILIDETLEGDPITDVKIEPIGNGAAYDTGLLYDSNNSYDSPTTDQRVVSFSNRGGRAISMAWQFSTNTTGIRWGLGAFSVDVDILNIADEAGVNNSGNL